MIKANELRIGNYVKAVIDITDGFKTGDLVEITCICDDANDFEPIPLTEEWLLKFGFEKTGSFYSKNNLEFYVNGNSDVRFHMDDYRHIVLNYVHQLQNLYFALTGEELTYAV